MSRRGAVVLGNAIIWAAVIFATAHVLEGTPYARQMQLIVGGGAAASIIIVGGGTRSRGTGGGRRGRPGDGEVS